MLELRGQPKAFLFLSLSLSKTMDSLLCDELLMEIFQRLPALSLSTVTLVSKRWLRLSRRSTTFLSLHLPNFPPSLPSLLLHFPFLSSLSLSTTTTTTTTANSADRLLLTVASSCPGLRSLRFLPGPLSLSSLLSLSSTSPLLTSLTIPLSRPLNLSWVPSFRSLKDLSVLISGDYYYSHGDWVSQYFDVKLKLESFSISGLSSADLGMGWFWKNCSNLKRLRLRSCDGVGDGGAFSSFEKCLSGLAEVELRSCRSISDMILIKLAENSVELNSLLVYDGGSKDGLLHFINNCKSKLLKLDLRLPLDLENQHLSSIGLNIINLYSLKLQSCCLVTGDGLKAFSLSLSNNLEELALINCDVVDRVPGLLTTLGQNLKKLRSLDLSYNEMLGDKELVSMLVSCNCLVDLKLRGCKGLSNMTLMSIVRVCGNLESIDVVHCCGIGAQGVEFLVLNSKQLRKVYVEQNKLSNDAMAWVSKRFIQVAV